MIATYYVIDEKYYMYLNPDRYNLITNHPLSAEENSPKEYWLLHPYSLGRMLLKQLIPISSDKHTIDLRSAFYGTYMMADSTVAVSPSKNSPENDVCTVDIDGQQEIDLFIPEVYKRLMRKSYKFIPFKDTSIETDSCGEFLKWITV